MTDNIILRQGAPINKASKALILLHGRGGTAEDIITLADHFCDDQFYIAAPQAPNNTWYPKGFMSEAHLNEPILSASIEGIKKLIDDTSKHIPRSRIYLMGFSQGASLSLEISSRSAEQYGGIVAFTGALMGPTLDRKKYHGNFEGTKIFIGTSDQDPFVPLDRIEQSKDILVEMGGDVTLKVYKGMTHTITEEEINWVKEHIF